MIDKSFIEKIEEMAAPTVLEPHGDGVPYCAVRLMPVEHPMAKTLEVHTLGSLADLIMAGFVPGAGVALQVHSHESVRIIGDLANDTLQREVFAEAKAPAFGFHFGRFYGVEEFIIALKTNFLPSPEVDEIIALVGNLSDEEEVIKADDGITQRVTVHAGVGGVTKKTIKNPVVLRPYRTFREVEQPASEFLLRLQKGGGVALFTADGDGWKLAAVENIKLYLSKILTERELENPVIA
jgi:hypothetical protein